MGDLFEIACIQRHKGEIEVDPSICLNLTDENTSEDKFVIPLYRRLKNAIKFEVLSPTKLTRVPKFIFEKFAKVCQLRMINTGITTLNHESFALGHQLELLDLRRNQIMIIPTEIFANLNRLDSINLAYNEITFIQPNAFDRMAALKILILSNNQLQTIDLRSFTGAATLTELYLESNVIRSVASDAFCLPNLEILSLKDNRLTFLRTYTFDYATKLQKVDLSSNEFVEIGDLFRNCSELYSLNLNNNPLRDVNLFNLTTKMPNLSYLHLANTGFKVSDEERDGSNEKLTHLDLSGNNLSSPDILLSLSHFKSLKTIVLKNNEFSFLNHVSKWKDFFPRLDSIQLTQNPHLRLNWIRDFQPTLKHQNIKLTTDPYELLIEVEAHSDGT